MAGMIWSSRYQNIGDVGVHEGMGSVRCSCARCRCDTALLVVSVRPVETGARVHIECRVRDDDPGARGAACLCDGCDRAGIESTRGVPRITNHECLIANYPIVLGSAAGVLPQRLGLARARTNPATASSEYPNCPKVNRNLRQSQINLHCGLQSSIFY